MFPIHLYAESFRTIVESAVVVTHDNVAGSSVPVGINSSALIRLGEEQRFFRGIELEITAPQAWLPYRGALVMAVYSSLNRQPAAGIADLEGTRIAFEALPGKLQTIYQIPLKSSHGLRTTPYVTIPAAITQPAAFPILFRLMPVAKGINDELESMIFTLTVRPILSDEGAVKLTPRYPPQLRGRPFNILIDDVLIENLAEQHLLKEGEHHLVVLSDDYRNESRLFLVERAKVLDLTVDLQDPTPLIVFEAPENAQILLNNVLIQKNQEPIAVEPGQHEVIFRIGDYTIAKTLNILKGKTYRVAMTVDFAIHETD